MTTKKTATKKTATKKTAAKKTAAKKVEVIATTAPVVEVAAPAPKTRAERIEAAVAIIANEHDRARVKAWLEISGAEIGDRIRIAPYDVLIPPADTVGRTLKYHDNGQHYFRGIVPDGVQVSYYLEATTNNPIFVPHSWNLGAVTTRANAKPMTLNDNYQMSYKKDGKTFSVGCQTFKVSVLRAALDYIDNINNPKPCEDSLIAVKQPKAKSKK